MDKLTLRDLYKLRSTLKNRMVILNKIKEGGHYKNSVHSRGIESFTKNFLDPFCTINGFNVRWNNVTSSYGTGDNNHIKWGVKGQMQKLVVELRIILKNEGDKILTYDILCKLVTEYYLEYEKGEKVRGERNSNKPHDNTKRLYPGHVKLRRLMDIEEKQGFNTYGNSYYSPYNKFPRIKINLP